MQYKRLSCAGCGAKLLTWDGWRGRCPGCGGIEFSEGFQKAFDFLCGLSLFVNRGTCPVVPMPGPGNGAAPHASGFPIDIDG